MAKRYRYQLFSEDIPTQHKSNDLDALKERAKQQSKLFNRTYQILMNKQEVWTTDGGGVDERDFI